MVINFDYLFDEKRGDYLEILNELRNGTAQLIDIREKLEWEQGRFKCAIHLPLSALTKGDGVEVLRRIKEQKKKIFLHCKSGTRVRQAQKILALYGCTEFSVIPISMLRMIEEGFQLTP